LRKGLEQKEANRQRGDGNKKDAIQYILVSRVIKKNHRRGKTGDKSDEKTDPHPEQKLRKFH
jgi:hypothetical protein